MKRARLGLAEAAPTADDGLGRDEERLLVLVVQRACQLPCELEVLELVVTDGNVCCAAVRVPANGIAGSADPKRSEPAFARPHL